MINIYDSIAYRMNNKCPCGFEVSILWIPIEATVKNFKFRRASGHARQWFIFNIWQKWKIVRNATTGFRYYGT